MWHTLFWTPSDYSSALPAPWLWSEGPHPARCPTLALTRIDPSHTHAFFAVAALVISLFPHFPASTMDHRCHLQAREQRVPGGRLSGIQGALFPW